MEKILIHFYKLQLHTIIEFTIIVKNSFKEATFFWKFMTIKNKYFIIQIIYIKKLTSWHANYPCLLCNLRMLIEKIARQVMCTFCLITLCVCVLVCTFMIHILSLPGSFRLGPRLTEHKRWERERGREREREMIGHIPKIAQQLLRILTPHSQF